MHTPLLAPSDPTIHIPHSIREFHIQAATPIHQFSRPESRTRLFSGKRPREQLANSSGYSHCLIFSIAQHAPRRYSVHRPLTLFPRPGIQWPSSSFHSGFSRGCELLEKPSYLLVGAKVRPWASRLPLRRGHLARFPEIIGACRFEFVQFRNNRIRGAMVPSSNPPGSRKRRNSGIHTTGRNDYAQGAQRV